MPRMRPTGTQNPTVRETPTKDSYSLVYYKPDGGRGTKTFHATSKRAAQLQANAFIAEINRERQERTKSPSMALGIYAETVYLPWKRGQWKASTAVTTEQRIRQHIIGGSLAAVPLAQLDRTAIQGFLDAKALEPRSVVSHLRFDLRAILALAISDGLVQTNQADVCRTPGTCAAPDQPVMTADDVRRALSVLDVRERCFYRLAVYAGMRPGEICGLKWADIDEHARTAVVDDRWYNGQPGTVKTGKPRVVALSDSVMTDLHVWHMLAASGSEYIFAAEGGKTPVKYTNLWQRDIRPRLQSVGLGWADFRCARRTNATLMAAAGADPVVAAANRGHGVNVSINDYTRPGAGPKAEAVGLLEGYIT